MSFCGVISLNPTPTCPSSYTINPYIVLYRAITCMYVMRHVNHTCDISILQPYGYVLYRAVLTRDIENAILDLNVVRDRGYVMLNEVSLLLFKKLCTEII